MDIIMRSRVLVIWVLLLIASPSLYAEEGVHIDFFSAGCCEGDSPVAVRFSEQMVPFGDPRTLASPFEV